MKYRRKETVTAVQWWKHGDHPAVHNGRGMRGKWIVTFSNGAIGVLSDEAFRAEFEPIEEMNDDHG